MRRLNRLDGRPKELAVDLGVFHEFAVGDFRLERRPVDVLVVHASLLALLGGARGLAADVREPVGELLVERAVDCLSTDARGAAEDDWYDWFALVGISRGENVGSLLDDDVLELLVRDIRIVEADRALPQPGIEPALLLSLRGDQPLLQVSVSLGEVLAKPALVLLKRRRPDVDRHRLVAVLFLDLVRHRRGRHVAHAQQPLLLRLVQRSLRNGVLVSARLVLVEVLPRGGELPSPLHLGPLVF